MLIDVARVFANSSAYPLRTIELSGHAIGHGSFSRIFGVLKINERPPFRPMVLKIFRRSQEAKQLVIRTAALVRRFGQARKSGLRSTPAGLGFFPQAAILGDWEGQQLGGALMPRIGGDYTPFEQRGNEIPNVQRYRLASSLARSVQALHSKLSCYHADLRPDHVYAKIGEDSMHLIDFDGGAPMGENAIGVGRHSPYLAPEVWEGQTNEASPLSDLWALGILIGELLLDTQPQEFLGLGRFHPAQRPSVIAPHVHDRFAQLPSAPRELLNRCLGPGSDNPAVRPNPEEWIEALTIVPALSNPARLPIEASLNKQPLFRLTLRQQITKDLPPEPPNIPHTGEHGSPSSGPASRIQPDHPSQ